MKRGLKCLAKMLSAIPVYPDITQKRHSKVLFSFWLIRVTLQSAHRCLLAGDSRLFPYLTEVIKQCGYLVGLSALLLIAMESVWATFFALEAKHRTYRTDPSQYLFDPSDN